MSDALKAVVLAIALAAALPTPAAACHRYSGWDYPRPRDCSVTHPQRPPARFVRLAVSVPVSAPAAPPTEDELRQQAVERLKVEFAMRNTTASANVPPMSPATVPPMSR